MSEHQVKKKKPYKSGFLNSEASYSAPQATVQHINPGWSNYQQYSTNYQVYPQAQALQQTMAQYPQPHVVASWNATQPNLSMSGKSTQSVFPFSLQALTEQTLSSAKDDNEKNFYKQHLMNLINKATEEKRLWTTNWSSTVIPKPPTSQAPITSNYTNNSTVKSAAVPTKTITTTQHNAVPQSSDKKRPFEAANEDILAKRQRLYAPITAATTKTPEPAPPSSNGVIVGTCTNLEKEYLRLTAPPDPSTVRPEHILKKTLKMLVTKYEKENAEYNPYILFQFKSLRQDLTVQRIRNTFTVKVYETHAKIALNNGDLSEFNQCQTQLKELYHEGIEGHVFEFTAYRILYLLFTDAFTDLAKLLKELPAAVKQHSFVKFALNVHSAMAVNNYYRVLKIYYSSPPKMVKSLMNLFIVKIRTKALKTFIKGHNTTELPVAVVQDYLGYLPQEQAQCMDFLIEQKVCLSVNDIRLIDCKRTVATNKW